MNSRLEPGRSALRLSRAFVGHPERAKWRAYADRNLFPEGLAILGPGLELAS